jgi:hypothetical protein
MSKIKKVITLPPELAPHRKVSVPYAAALNSMSEDTFRRYFSHLIKQLSPRRQAVDLRDALAIGERKDSTAA